MLRTRKNRFFPEMMRIFNMSESDFAKVFISCAIANGEGHDGGRC